MSEEWFEAAIKGDLQTIQRMYQQFAQSKDSSDRTALMYAAMHSKNDVVQFLAQHEHSMQTRQGYTALMMGIINRNPQIVSLLKMEVDLKTADNTTALMIALAAGYYDLTGLLKLQGQFNNIGLSAYSIAILQQNSSYIDQYFATEANIIAPNGITTLMIAAAAGNLELCKRLAQQYHNMLGQTDRNHKSALRYCFDALEKNDSAEEQDRLIEIVDFLRPHEYKLVATDQVNTMMLAARENLPDVVQDMLQEYRTFKDASGKTALMYAAEAGSLECVELLVDAEKKMQDELGKTACIYACEGDQYDCFMKLVEHEYELRDKENRHCVHYACKVNAVEIVEAVAETFIGHADDKDVTSLMVAAQYGSYQCIQYLLKEQSMTDINGNNALFYAAQYDKPRCCRSLLQLVKTKNSDGQTPLDYAMQHGSYKVIPILIAAEGAKRPVLFDLARDNNYKACKVVCDVGRASACPSLCGKTEYSAKEATVCKKQMSMLTSGYPQCPDDYTALHVAVMNDAYETIRVLAPIFSQSCDRSGISALMLFVQKEAPKEAPEGGNQDYEAQRAKFQQYTKACDALVEFCGGMQTTKPGTSPVGTTALMFGISLMVEVNNTYVLKKLFPVEKDIVDKSGIGWESYARQVGMVDEIKKWE